MTATEKVDIAILKQQVADLKEQLDKNTATTLAIKETLDNLSGGKQALMWITGLVVSIGVIVVTWWSRSK